jgi:hypothetical protein
MEAESFFINFEQAKFFKEKGFEMEVNNYYELALTSKKDKQDGYTGAFGWKKGELNRQSCYFINNHPKIDTTNSAWYLCACPFQWQVLVWLTIHSIYIRYTVEVIGTDEWCYGYTIWYIPKEFSMAKRRCSHVVTVDSFKEGIGSYTGGWHTPSEANSEAINYVIKNNLL